LQIAQQHPLRNPIIELLESSEIGKQTCYQKMLDYIIELFNSQGLGSDYYGYHNIDHELEVTFVTLKAASSKNDKNDITTEELRHLYVAALVHDFDPLKHIDKPHEENVIKFVAKDKEFQKLIKEAKLDFNLIKSLVFRTVYPWSGQIKEDAEKQIEECLQLSPITKNKPKAKEHYKNLGWFLSVSDRIGGYALGDFSKAMTMAKMNAHASAWHPLLIVRRSVAYYEDLLNNESEMTERILFSLPTQMRKNFMNNVISFMKLRQRELQNKASLVYENLTLIPVTDSVKVRTSSEFIKTVLTIYDELPRPLQFQRIGFTDSCKDPETVLCTLRLNKTEGEIIGFAKGGPIENYKLRSDVCDDVFGKKNTIFMEPIALKQGFWGLKGGGALQNKFYDESRSAKFQFLSSYWLRELVEKKKQTEQIEYHQKFDPERMDYYRLQL